MVRFFVTPEELLGEVIALRDENAQHAKVLRLKAGEEVLLCDGAGHECLCQITDAVNYEVTVKERRESTTKACVQVSVYMAFPKADKLEHVIQKATELGACEIVAFPSGRCVSKPDEKSLFYKGRFTVEKANDTFLMLQSFTKGFVTINGFNIGRYWEIGPQQTLYVPASILREGENEIVVFESDGIKGEAEIEFCDKPVLG